MKRPLAPDTAIAHYRLLAPLGAGGMGEVYLAEDTKLSRKVALKLLPAEFTKDADRVRRFEQEAKAVSALNHPHIITIHEIGEAEVGRFIVMELVRGQTLRALDKPCAPDLLVNIGGQIAKALIATHAAGVTHRDIKPDNIMLRDDGYVKILDFGLARLTPETATDSEAATLMRQTTPGALVGAVAYMSPEQARGESARAASDVFSLGIVFYELATGRHPFKADSIVGMLHAINSQTPAAPARLIPDLLIALESLILRMLEKEARFRPTAAEVDQSLRELSGRSGNGQFQRPAAKPSASRHTVGREKELALLRAGFESALNGRGQLFCVAGEPGIGKTTVVEDFLAELTAEGQSMIARGRCSERLAGTEAYLPLLESLESLLQSGGDPSIARALKQIAPTWYAQVAPLSGGDEESARLLAEVKAASQERMKRELGSFLQEVARLRPLVLFFDDLHWADVSTIDLLSFLAGKFDALNALIVVTYRPSDMLLVKHPFLQIKPDLQARGLCRELQLEFLNEQEIAEYLALEFPQHRFPAELHKLIHAKTEGSPLFIADLVRYLRDHNVIAQKSGAWTLAQALPDIERELPESVRGMIDRKIAQLSEEDHKLLTAASVQGYEFDSAVVAQALGIGADEVEERLEKLERVYAFVRLVSEAEFPNRALTLRYRFVHTLYQNALYASLRPTRKAAISGTVAQVLLDFHGEQSHSVASELACLFESARDFTRAADYFRLAARNAVRIFAGEEAAILARRGLDIVKTLPDTPGRARQELLLQLILGNSVGLSKGYASLDVGTSLNRAREICQQLGETHYLFRATYGLWAYYFIGADFHAARQMGEQLLHIAQSTQDPILLIGAHTAVGETLLYMGDFVQGREHSAQAFTFHDSHKNSAYRAIYGIDPGVFSQCGESRALWLLGYPDQARRMSDDALSLAHESANPRTIANTLHQAPDSRPQQDEVEECFHQAIEITRRQRAKSLELRAVMSLARLWRQKGKTAEARQMLAEVYGWFTEGFDTADLKEAKALLNELQEQSAA